MVFKIAWLYYDLLELYSDVGNIKVMESILKDNDIDVLIDKVSIGDDVDFSLYDFIFIGGGSDFNQNILSEDLFSKRELLEKALHDKTFILTICGGYQMFGKYYKDYFGNKIKCLDIFEYYTESGDRCVGNLKIKPNESMNISDNIIGFENHGGHTKGILKGQEFGTVVNGYGNNGDKELEGYMDDFFIGTYMHGPLLPKNPEIAKYIIEKVLKEKHGIIKEINIKYLEEAKMAKEEVKF